ncbi:hypothetical protein [Clostridium algidicarnis]|uniref:hypothetical protein n=1 Tax=Clostridium algidicarnis TaxID=37659 RepID=UPI001C0E1E37|nr:hypothetical protein [Clostridium algidicarnis]MBU3196137.1 hypothetical protein [Clostridium algidicarnis]MBU3209179.1 hypothetical protein [Clostridium algidicarnis]MBU3229151.1 hypothetical protein [Clostridium algidicarnis]MBU3252665.1 hypothetical protein [Clostridium algidicarnis]
MDITNLISELTNNAEGLNMEGLNMDGLNMNNLNMDALNMNNISSLMGGKGCSNNNNLLILIFLIFCCCNKGGFGQGNQGNQGNTICLEACDCKCKKKKCKCCDYCERPEQLICRPVNSCNNSGFGGFGGSWCWIIILILILCSNRGNSTCKDKC